MTYRALLTEREREVLRDDIEVSPNYVNQVRYRVREKLPRLRIDAELLREHQPDLASELRETLVEAFDLD